MPDSYHPLHTSIVRNRRVDGTIVGAGFLAAPGLVCTCAHVVADAQDILRGTLQTPEQEIYLDFPFLGGAVASARAQVWVPIKPSDDSSDIATLRLETPVPQRAKVARILSKGNLSGRNFETYGFPRFTDVDQFAYGDKEGRVMP